jgi:hypothetical protein
MIIEEPELSSASFELSEFLWRPARRSAAANVLNQAEVAKAIAKPVSPVVM